MNFFLEITIFRCKQLNIFQIHAYVIHDVRALNISVTHYLKENYRLRLKSLVETPSSHYEIINFILFDGDRCCCGCVS